MAACLHRPGFMFNGSIAALVTPFTGRGEIDFAALEKLARFHRENGTDALVIAGTTGESATLTAPEYTALLKWAVGRFDGVLPVLAGTGSASTAVAVERTRLACGLGADAVLVVTPYYNRPTQKGLEAHFRTVADASDKPLVLYNVPTRTAVDLQPETVERLSGHPRIVGIKEAVGAPERVRELVSRCGAGFTVLSGDDGSCLSAMKEGARGVVSVAANVAPGAMRELCAEAAAGNWERAERLNDRLRPLFRALMLESNPIPVKWSLCEMNLIGPGIRLPLTELDESLRAPLRQCLSELGLLK
ncbi:MAG: 4-hydroxy-tetrahydrodipicolinate synthase [Lysobacterales bacterium]